MVAPIAIFAFNRPQHLLNLFLTLIKNDQVYLQKVYVFVDGPRTSADKLKINEVCETASEFSKYFDTMEIIRRKKNLGSANNIVEGVSNTLDKFPTVIVLEDDLILGKYFLQYMNDALVRYELNPLVYHISGFSEFNNENDYVEAYFSRGMNCWGWATWKHNWHFLERNVDIHLGNFSKADVKRLNFDGSTDFFSQLTENKIGVLRSWAIFWYASIFHNGGLCLNPTKALAINKGNDGSGEHVGLVSHHQVLYDGPVLNFPEIVEENQQYFLILQSIYKSKNNYIKYLIRKIISFAPAGFQIFFYNTYRALVRKIK